MKPIAFPLELTPRGHFVDASGRVLHVSEVLTWANAAAGHLGQQPARPKLSEVIAESHPTKAILDHFKRRSE